MNLRDQLCTPEQAEKLEQLGVIQHQSSFYYAGGEYFYWPEHGLGVVISQSATVCTYSWLQEGHDDYCVLFTAAELAVMLPDKVASWRFIHPTDNVPQWIATVLKPKEPGDDSMSIATYEECDRYAPTQAQALASLLIDALESGLTTIEEVNARMELSVGIY